MKLSKKRLFKPIFFTLIILLLICGIVGAVHFFAECHQHIRYKNLRGLATAMEVYRNDNNDMLPDLDQWCDTLIEEADCSPKSFLGAIDSQEGVCGYALNENLKGLKFSELTDKVVLVFEAKGPWNLSGEQELARKTNYKNIAVIFVDGSVDFVTKDEIDTLQWKP